MTQNSRWNHPHDPSRSESKCAMSDMRGRQLQEKWKRITQAWLLSATASERFTWAQTFYGRKVPRFLKDYS